MSLPNLGFIITGQLRTFFTEKVFASTYNWLTHLNHYYTLYIVCVINEENINYSKFTFLKDVCKEYKIVKFDNSCVEYPTNDFFDPIFKDLKERGFYDEIMKETNNNLRIPMLTYIRQKKHLEVGVKTMKEFGVEIPTYVRTRFDMFHGVHLIPYSNSNPLFPHSKQVEDFQMKLLSQAGFSSVEEYISFIKSQDMNTIRIPEKLWQVNFGGSYYYNTDIFDSNEKLWLANDHVFIGKAELFEKYCNCDLLKDPQTIIKIAREKGHNYIFSAEALLALHLYSVNITPILLLNAYVIYIQRE